MNWFTDRHCFLLAVVFYGLSTLYAVFLWRKGFRRDDWVNYFLLATGVALHTLFRAAAVLGKKLRVELVE